MSALSLPRVSLLTASFLAIGILAAPTMPLSALSPASLVLQSQDPAPDNSAKNKDHGTTADKQSNSAQDVEIARQIRKAIVSDKSLSTYAKNVKVIVKNGAVTLRGPVRSEEEKGKIAEYASQAATGGNVTNQLTVKPS